MSFFSFCVADTDGKISVTLNDVLQFWNGANQVPPLGFHVQPSIDFFTREPDIRNGGYLNRLPSSSTCGLVLFLPRGITVPDDFEQAMITAIHSSGGFGKL